MHDSNKSPALNLHLSDSSEGRKEEDFKKKTSVRIVA